MNHVEGSASSGMAIGLGRITLHDQAGAVQPHKTDTDPMPSPNRQNRNAEVDFRGEKRSNATHTSTIDPDARLYNKAPGTGAMLSFIGHALMEMCCCVMLFPG